MGAMPNSFNTVELGVADAMKELQRAWMGPLDNDLRNLEKLHGNTQAPLQWVQTAEQPRT